jgi:tRNA threonylcarbamoyladenosine biosynthesis protein TsaE
VTGTATTNLATSNLVSTTVETTSAEATRSLAAALASAAQPGDRIALIGPLGAGKTQFAKGFAAGLGVRDVVNSPSFTLMAEYSGRLPLFHQDLYRLVGAEDALAGGLIDERQADGVTLSEWAERLPRDLDPSRMTVTFEVLGEDQRRIGVAPASADQQRYVRAAAQWASLREADDA